MAYVRTVRTASGAMAVQIVHGSPQFKAEAVQMVTETVEPIAQVARDLGIHDGTLGNWVNAWRRNPPAPAEPLTPVERARVQEMEAEIRRLRQASRSWR